MNRYVDPALTSTVTCDWATLGASSLHATVLKFAQDPV